MVERNSSPGRELDIRLLRLNAAQGAASAAIRLLQHKGTVLFPIDQYPPQRVTVAVPAMVEKLETHKLLEGAELDEDGEFSLDVATAIAGLMLITKNGERLFAEDRRAQTLERIQFLLKNWKVGKKDNRFGSLSGTGV